MPQTLSFGENKIETIAISNITENDFLDTACDIQIIPSSSRQEEIVEKDFVQPNRAHILVSEEQRSANVSVTNIYLGNCDERINTVKENKFFSSFGLILRNTLYIRSIL